MDNFRRYRSRSDHSSTDGFIRSTPAPRVGPAVALKRGNAYHAEKSRIGNFRSPDGFHPVRREHHQIGEQSAVTPPDRRQKKVHEEKARKNRLRSPAVKKKRFARLRNLFFFNPLKWRN